MSLQHSEARADRLREERAEARRYGVPVKARTVIDKTWTEAEDDTVRRLYPDYAAMVAVLRHRSYSALRNRADKLGLRTKRHVWTTAEQARLRELWAKSSSAELRAAFPGLSRLAIVKQGEFLGLPPRGKPPLVLTGDPLCDALRDRCRELGYSMTDLDRMACSGTYFATGAWARKAGHRLTPMVRAVRALGGVLNVEWPD